MIKPLNQNLPDMGWKIYDHWPEAGTIFHVLETGTIVSKHGETAAIPGGMFCRSMRADGRWRGEYRVLTLPESALKLLAFSTKDWSWDCAFIGFIRGQAIDERITIEVVPNDIADAVQAMLVLDGWSEGDKPMVVDDGWLV